MVCVGERFGQGKGHLMLVEFAFEQARSNVGDRHRAVANDARQPVAALVVMLDQVARATCGIQQRQTVT